MWASPVPPESKKR